MKDEIKQTSPFDDIEQWEASRRTFLKGAILAGALSQLSWFTSCSEQLKSTNTILNEEQSATLDKVLMIFFPNDGNGPSADDINTFGYIIWVLEDSLNRKTEDNSFIIEGIDRLNERSQELFKSYFSPLKEKQQNKVIEAHVEDDETRKWCSALITLIFEALLLDPIYGGNVEEQGWEWLNHTPGFPRPTQDNRYEVIMRKQRKIKTP